MMMFADGVLLPVALWFSIVLRYGELRKDVSPFWWLFLVAAVSGVVALNKFGLYRAVVRYIGPSSMVPVIKGVTAATIIVSLTAYLTQAVGFPRSSPVIFWFISIMLIGGIRISVRGYFYGWGNNYLVREPIAIYGAGDSGAQLAITLLNGVDYMPAAFIDDNRSLRKNIIHGIRVYDSAHIDRLIDNFGIKQIFLAVPSATAEQRSIILNRLASLPILVKTIPTFEDLISGSARVNEVKEVEIGDLLGRETVPPIPELMQSSIKSKAVLVTGAGGTIGSELCRIILRLQPSRLVLYDNSEYAIYNLEKELKSFANADIEMVFLLGSIMNKRHLTTVMNNFQVKTVYHTAAFKHVPIVENNIIEGVRNNVVGTWNVAISADESRVEELVLVSSDKAVRPKNVMGATKRLAELIIQAFAARSDHTRYCMVRFGNVLRSSGSVVPLFEKQILSGGPVTVTHKDATRYFMTTSEAAELVIQAGAMAKGGELFVLDMGEPVSVNDLAVKMIHLHGKEVKSAASMQRQGQQLIEIDYVGLRPGEKLHEELVIGESISGTRHPKIMMAEEESLTFDEVSTICLRLQQACENADFDTVKTILETYVDGYALYASNSDPVWAIGNEKKRQNNVMALVVKED